MVPVWEAWRINKDQKVTTYAEVGGVEDEVIVIEPGIIETEFGSTMIEPMMERSGSFAYSEMAKKMEAATMKSYARGRGGSSPTSVAQTVSKALKARRPKTRYAVGKMAKPLMFLRKRFGDRIFDRVVLSSMKANQ